MSGSKVFTFDPTIALTGMALHAYKERQQHMHDTKIKTELATQARIDGINIEHQERAVIVPSQAKQLSIPINTDSQFKIKALQSKIEQIKREYRELVEYQLLDSQTVEKALCKVETALSSNELAVAETQLQLLDDARILGVQLRHAKIRAHVEYLQARIRNLQPNIPKQIVLDLEKRVSSYRNDWMQCDTAQEIHIHAYINELEAQVEQIQIAADNLVDSWLEVGYDARIIGIDDGDIVIQVATHDCANTEIRIQFTGEKIDLLAPSEEPELCTDRTFAALRLFQQQGYQLQWTYWDGNVIPGRWRNLYSNTDSASVRLQMHQAQQGT
ncbi:hypothetical protein NIES4071_24790 [Calothrix sp. NIES-4071]|nr:hypothetical protein NIES4071_24790 [Calothrix sp. NIES-4071]BAZ56802.1 hypothetical protein NIES4105_24730 [Calothrix sp. NIES-4105]